MHRSSSFATSEHAPLMPQAGMGGTRHYHNLNYSNSNIETKKI
jgi:hypothetical protein